MTHLTFKIGLGLFDFKQLLVDSGTIVQWNDFQENIRTAFQDIRADKNKERSKYKTPL